MKQPIAFAAVTQICCNILSNRNSWEKLATQTTECISFHIIVDINICKHCSSLVVSMLLFPPKCLLRIIFRVRKSEFESLWQHDTACPNGQNLMLSLREEEKAEHPVHPIDSLNPFCRGSGETNAVPETTRSGDPSNCLKGKYQASAENYETSLQHLPLNLSPCILSPFLTRFQKILLKYFTHTIKSLHLTKKK